MSQAHVSFVPIKLARGCLSVSVDEFEKKAVVFVTFALPRERFILRREITDIFLRKLLSYLANNDEQTAKGEKGKHKGVCQSRVRWFFQRNFVLEFNWSPICNAFRWCSDVSFGLWISCVWLVFTLYMCKCYIYIYNITPYSRNESKHFPTRRNNVQFLNYLSSKNFCFFNSGHNSTHALVDVEHSYWQWNIFTLLHVKWWHGELQSKLILKFLLSWMSSLQSMPNLLLVRSMYVFQYERYRQFVCTAFWLFLFLLYATMKVSFFMWSINTIARVVDRW